MAYNSAPLISKSHLVIFLTLGYLRGLGHKSCNDVTLRKQNCYKHLLWNGAFGFLLSGSPEWTAPVISSLHPQGSPLSGNRQALKKLILEGTGLGWWVGAWLGLYFFFFFKSWFQFCNSVLGQPRCVLLYLILDREWGRDKSRKKNGKILSPLLQMIYCYMW